jgi:hypothetical protein
MKTSIQDTGKDFLRDNLLNLYVKQIAMYTKLTLNIEKDTVAKAKVYAKQQNQSLSKLIEAYLKSLAQEHASLGEVSPLVSQLTGLIPAHFDEKEAYQNYQAQKHA